MKKIKTVLVANRGEIAIRVFRACNELGIRTVAIYSKEDTLSLHRNRADEAYLVGEGKGPIDAYLDIEDIMRIAREHDVDAIHPGYGFLSENSQLAKRCAEEGFIFIGPRLEHLIMFGDKINARTQAELAGIPMIPGSTGTVSSVEEVRAFAGKHGFPIIIKAVNGGGGRGMRMVASMDELDQAYSLAKSEALKAFGSDEIYLEKYLQNPKHIEVQIIGDTHGNIVHLHERDCSVQRRHQKLVEVAPAFSLPQQLRSRICEAAVKLMKNVDYISAGTVEFLATPDNNFYFIEVNPRIQVEHTVTEEITGIDIVQTQIKIAEGYSIHDPEIAIPEQKDIITHGHAIQCRITTEDPANNFMPDTGKLIAYRSGGGFGVRLDGGNAFTGSVITPYYDSLLVKATTWGLTHQIAISKMLRCLKEFRIRGVKTNILFLENVLQHPQFTDGSYSTKFVDDNTDLFIFPKTHDRGTKLLNYIADISINGYSNVGVQPKPEFAPLNMPKPFIGKIPDGSKQVLDAHGPAGLAKWVQAQSEVLITDTTFRDAHQSLFATRLRTNDMMKVAAATAGKLPNLFSFECWGGATFDVAYRFLDESPWDRLQQFRIKAPNILLQMLLRGANAVGYTSYPDNVVKEFIHLAAKNGVDVFRIFDSLNGLDNMRLSIDTVRECNKVAEAIWTVHHPWQWVMEKARENAARYHQKPTSHAESWYGFYSAFLAARYFPNESLDKQLSNYFDRLYNKLHDSVKVEPLYFKTRIQNTSTTIGMLVDKYEAQGDLEDLKKASKLADWMIATSQRENGAYYNHGTVYTSVIYIAKSVLELAVLERKLGEQDLFWRTCADRHFLSAKKAVDQLVASQGDFQTEGELTFEDGMISCSALQIGMMGVIEQDAVARKYYTDAMLKILNSHDCLTQLRVPDGRRRQGTMRYWEAQYDVQMLPNMFNSPHGWSGWRAYATYYAYLLTGDEKWLEQTFNAMGAFANLIDYKTGQLRWAFVVDPHLEVEQARSADTKLDFSDLSFGNPHPKLYDTRKFVIGEQYVNMISDWQTVNTQDNDVHELFKCIGEAVLTNAFVIERPNGEVVGYNCRVTRKGNTLTVKADEKQIVNLHCNLKHSFSVSFDGKTCSLPEGYCNWAFGQSGY